MYETGPQSQIQIFLYYQKDVIYANFTVMFLTSNTTR